MRIIKGITLCIVLCILFPACAYLDKSATQNHTATVPASDCTEKTRPLSDRIEILQNRSSALELKNKDLADLNIYLNHETKRMDVELKKRDAIIHIQEDVIQLLDDPGKTIQTGLLNEIEEKMKALEKSSKTRKYVFTNRELFIPKTFKISEKGKEKLLNLAKTMKEHEKQSISVEGHTDNIPVTGALEKAYPSNWEISTARAAAVVRFLQTGAGIQSERMTVVGFGPTRPVASNQTEEGRRKNQRVEIILGPPL
jgi:chemotaxis protein MotB